MILLLIITLILILILRPGLILDIIAGLLVISSATCGVILRLIIIFSPHLILIMICMVILKLLLIYA